MKPYPYFAAIVLSGCAAQPYQPPMPAPVPSVHDRCIHHWANLGAFASVSEPILDACVAGDKQQCVIFAGLADKVSIKYELDAAQACLQSGAIGASHPLVIAVLTDLKRQTPKLKKVTR